MENEKREAAIKITHLKKAYGEKEVLKDLNLEVYPGELFGFIGKNGVGKSTTIDCMIGAKKYDDGQILLNGFDIVKDDIEAKTQFGYVASEPNCYEVMTGYEYLDFIASVYHLSEKNYQENTKYLAKRLSLSEEDLKQPTAAYSHGMKQKLCLIASLLHRPSIWILDEPTVGLDVMAVEELNRMMRDYANHGQTVFITSHNIDLVSSLCDRVAIINNGVVSSLLDLNQIPNYRLQLRHIFLETYQEKD
ncbi:MAG: ABC transporter ATP-binding protein [Erysipelotrichaceae bacterium]|nr:ABC transporter ATP-binding protein [Erysipelotrichaceae bacterium]